VDCAAVVVDAASGSAARIHNVPIGPSALDDHLRCFQEDRPEAVLFLKLDVDGYKERLLKVSDS
jgi:hypothetical protein